MRFHEIPRNFTRFAHIFRNTQGSFRISLRWFFRLSTIWCDSKGLFSILFAVKILLRRCRLIQRNLSRLSLKLKFFLWILPRYPGIFSGLFDILELWVMTVWKVVSNSFGRANKILMGTTEIIFTRLDLIQLYRFVQMAGSSLMVVHKWRWFDFHD